MTSIASFFLPTVIAPSLQAAALRMAGPEFNALTEQVRDHLLAEDHEKLKNLLQGHQIEFSPETIQQIVVGRSAFFGDSVGVLLKRLGDASKSENSLWGPGGPPSWYIPPADRYAIIRRPTLESIDLLAPIRAPEETGEPAAEDSPDQPLKEVCSVRVKPTKK